MERRPFVFGVGYILDEPGLEDLLHKQFSSDTELAEYIKSKGFELDFRNPGVTYDVETGVSAETVLVKKSGGGVGCLDLIDEKDRSKLQKLINEAEDIQRRRKLGDKSVAGLFG